MRRIALPLSTLALSLAACKKDASEQTPKEQAPAPMVEEVEISRAYPEQTWGSMTVVQPGALLDSIATQAQPGYDWRAKVEAKRPGVLAGLDLDAPVDALFGHAPKSADAERIAFSFGVRDAASAKTSFEAAGLSVREQGEELAFDLGELGCRLPKSAKRVTCWAGPEDAAQPYLDALRARTHEGDARVVFTVDLAYLRGPMKTDIDGGAAMAKMLGPQAFESLKDPQLREDATALLTDVVDGALAFVDDLDRLELTLGTQPGDAGMYARARARLAKRDSTIAKMFSPEYLPAGPAPAELFALPADVDSASYTREVLPSPGLGADFRSRAEAVVRGVAREFELPDAELTPLFAALRGPERADWTVTVVPRRSVESLEAANIMARGDQRAMVWMSPKSNRDPFAAFAAAETYLRHPKVAAKIQPFLAQIEAAGMGMKAPKVTSEPIEGLGTRAHRFHLEWELGPQMAAQGSLPERMDFVMLLVETDSRMWTALGPDEAQLRDYLDRAMAGKGPTLAEDPRTAFLKDEKAWMATYTPVDPVYIGEFVTSLLGDLSEFSQDLGGGGESAVFREFEARMPDLVEKWKQLPPSAARSRLVFDEQGIVYEGSTPATTLRMVGDAAQTMYEVYAEQRG